MTYFKQEYEIDGIEVTIQQVRGPESSHGASEPSAWINGGAAYALDAIEALPLDVSGKSPLDKVKVAVAFMVDNDVRFCKKCNTFRDIGTFVSTGFAGRKCSVCADRDSTCSDGDSHDYKCLNPNQKHNARVATKYKCKTCGKKKSTTPTG